MHDLAHQRLGLIDEAYAAIRRRILDGSIPPGSRLTVRPLADTLDLSATPIKGAFAALEREGLIESRLHKGFFVPELGADDVREIYDLREALDGISAERAASAHSTDRAQWLLDDCSRQHDMVKAADIDGFHQADLEFHRTIWAMSGNSRIQKVGSTLLDQMRLSALSANQPQRAGAAVTEHFLIARAILAGDSERARTASIDHVKNARHAFELTLVLARKAPAAQ